MKNNNKHYKFINGKTGNAIFYFTVSGALEPGKIKEELEKVRARVAIKNSIYLATVYWEEMKDQV